MSLIIWYRTVIAWQPCRRISGCVLWFCLILGLAAHGLCGQRFETSLADGSFELGPFRTMRWQADEGEARTRCGGLLALDFRRFDGRVKNIPNCGQWCF